MATWQNCSFSLVNCVLFFFVVCKTVAGNTGWLNKGSIRKKYFLVFAPGSHLLPPLRPHLSKDLVMLEYSGRVIFTDNQVQQRRLEVVTLSLWSTFPYQIGLTSWRQVKDDGMWVSSSDGSYFWHHIHSSNLILSTHRVNSSIMQAWFFFIATSQVSEEKHGDSF